MRIRRREDTGFAGFRTSASHTPTTTTDDGRDAVRDRDPEEPRRAHRAQGAEGRRRATARARARATGEATATTATPATGTTEAEDGDDDDAAAADDDDDDDGTAATTAKSDKYVPPKTHLPSLLPLDQAGSWADFEDDGPPRDENLLAARARGEGSARAGGGGGGGEARGG